KPCLCTLFRAFLGPLFDKPWQVIFSFICLVTFPLFGLLVLSFFFGRLVLKWKTLYRCKSNLEPVTKAPLELMVRLTDSEIELFSTLLPDEIFIYINEKAKTHFRWQLLQKKLITCTVVPQVD